MSQGNSALKITVEVAKIKLVHAKFSIILAGGAKLSMALQLLQEACGQEVLDIFQCFLAFFCFILMRLLCI